MNGPLVCFALLGKIPLTIGVVGHEGSTVVVVMNSLRLLFGGTVAKAKEAKAEIGKAETYRTVAGRATGSTRMSFASCSLIANRALQTWQITPG